MDKTIEELKVIVEGAPFRNCKSVELLNGAPAVWVDKTYVSLDNTLEIIKLRERVEELESSNTHAGLRSLYQKSQAKVAELEAELMLANQDAGFYRYCALSGEVPQDYYKPSNRAKNKHRSKAND